MVKECVVRLLSSLLLSLSFLPLLFFSFSLLLVLAEPVVNVGGFITYTRKYMRSPERWLLIKGKWDGEMLWWTLNRVWLRWEWKKWAEKCLLSFLPLTFAPNLPYFSPLPPRCCRPFPLLSAANELQYSSETSSISCISVHAGWLDCFQTEQKHPIWAEMGSKWIQDLHVNYLHGWVWAPVRGEVWTHRVQNAELHEGCKGK